MSSSTYANKILDNQDMGVLEWETIARAAIAFMSDDDLKEMSWNEGFFAFEENMDDTFFDVSSVNDNGTHMLVQQFNDNDDEDEALAFGEQYSHVNGVEIVVERVTDNGGARTEIESFDIHVVK